MHIDNQNMLNKYLKKMLSGTFKVMQFASHAVKNWIQPQWDQGVDHSEFSLVVENF